MSVKPNCVHLKKTQFISFDFIYRLYRLIRVRKEDIVITSNIIYRDLDYFETGLSSYFDKCLFHDVYIHIRFFVCVYIYIAKSANINYPNKT